jgi:hypothetical protein
MSYELNPAGDADWDTVGGEYLDNVCIHASAQDVISELVEDKREWNPYLNEAFFKEYKPALEDIVPEQLEEYRKQHEEAVDLVMADFKRRGIPCERVKR